MPASTVAGCGKQKPANVSSEQDSNSKSSREQGGSTTTRGEHIKTWLRGPWRSIIFIGKPAGCGDHQLLPVGCGYTHLVVGSWESVVHTWGNGQEIAEDFSLVSWVMRTVSE